MPISEATREEAIRLVQRYPVARSALLPLLHLVQAEEGYVSGDGVALCAELLHLTRAEVGATYTFYTMFKREPFGDWLLSICTNPTCKLMGGQEIFDAYVERCGGTIDREAGVMVEHAECLGICDAAPVVQINYEMYGPMGHDEAMALLDNAKAGDPPPSNWSGHTPATFAAVSRELSGIDDGVDEHLIEAARLQTRYEVPPAYRTGETDLPVTHPGGDPAGHGGEGFRAVAGLDLAPTTERGPGPKGELAEETREAAADVAEETAGTGEELARTAAGQAPAQPPTPAAEQPAVPEQDTPAAPEADQAPAEGSEELDSDGLAPRARGDDEAPRARGDDEAPRARGDESDEDEEG